MRAIRVASLHQGDRSVTPVEYGEMDGWEHVDGSISHDGEFSDKSVSDLMSRTSAASKWFTGVPVKYPDGPVYYHGYGSDRLQANTGTLEWDNNLFVTHDPAVAREYGPKVDRIRMALDTRVKRHEGHGQYLERLQKAKSEGYDVAEFHQPHDFVGHVVINRNKIVSRESIDPHQASRGGGRQTGARFIPDKRVFTHTDGLDHRLFDGEHLRPEVRSYILGTITTWWAGEYRDWSKWARVFFAGSEASEWTSGTLEGNGDLDILVGVDYDGCRATNPQLAGLTDQQITDRMNVGFRPHNGPVSLTVEGIQYGPFDRTTFVNKDSWDIRRIKPYAAYDVGGDEWVVKPPHLPHWSLSELPKPVQQVLRAADSYARRVLKLPEPERTQQGAALFEAWHSDRSRAFGPQGEGWWDIANLREKYGDQAGWWAQLVDCAHRAKQGLGAAPADWSNIPTGYVVTAKLPKTQKCDYCKQQATKRVIWAEGMGYIPVCDQHEQRAKDHVGDDYCNTRPIPKTAEAGYGYQHRPPGPPRPEDYYDGGQPAHDLNHGRTGTDMYERDRSVRTLDDNADPVTARTLRAARGNPEHPITMYRALPHEHADGGFYTGDWVTLSKSYAQSHARNNGGWPVIKATVPARHLWTNGDYNEWGYHGPDVQGEIHTRGRQAARDHTSMMEAPREGALPHSPGRLFYRVHPVKRGWSQENASSQPFGGGGPYGDEGEELPREHGYSAFDNPHDLGRYLNAMDWHRQLPRLPRTEEDREEGRPGRIDPHQVRVVQFPGEIVGHGHDGEHLARPHARADRQEMDYETFWHRLRQTPHPDVPYHWHKAPYERTPEWAEGNGHDCDPGGQGGCHNDYSEDAHEEGLQPTHHWASKEATAQIWITPQIVMGSAAGLNHARQVNSASEAVAAVQQGLTAVLPPGAWFPVRQVLLGLGMSLLDVNQRLKQFGAPASVTG